MACVVRTQGVKAKLAGYKKYAVFEGKMLIVGFGSVGQGSLPLILRHIDIKPEQITIITANAFGREIAGNAWRQVHRRADQARVLCHPVRQVSRARGLPGQRFLRRQQPRHHRVLPARGILYIDACIEPWPGGHNNTSVPAARRTNYAYREAALDTAQEIPQGPGRACSCTAPIPAWSRTCSSRRCSTSPRTLSAEKTAEPKTRDQVGATRATAGYQGHSYRRARQPGESAPQTAGRVRQHLVERSVRRRIAAAGRAGLGHAREELAARGPQVRFRLRRRRSTWNARVHRRACAPGRRWKVRCSAS